MFRTQQISVKSAVANGGEILRFKLPAFGVIGEVFLRIKLPALASGTYNASCSLNAISEVRLRHSDTFFTYRPDVYFPIALSRCDDAVEKLRLIRCFGDTSASGSAQSILVPIVHPWSLWADDEFLRGHRAHSERRRGLMQCNLLKDTMLIEVDVNATLSYTDSGALSGSDSPFDVVCFWEELVSNSMGSLKKTLPKAVCASEYTVLPGLANAGAMTEYNINALLSRAPTCALHFFVKLNSDSDTSPFEFENDVVDERLTADGRETIDTTEL